MADVWQWLTVLLLVATIIALVVWGVRNDRLPVAMGLGVLMGVLYAILNRCF